MLCDHQLVSEHLIDYCEGKLSSTNRNLFEQAIEQCDDCRETYRQAMVLPELAKQWHEQSVPEWHRTEFAVRPRATKASWLNWTALGASACAILMVLFQVNINAHNGGIQITFGGQADAQIEELVEQRLAEFKQQQNLLLEARFVAQTDKLTTANKLLMADLMEKTRDERREDLNFIITGIQTQRYEDQQKVEQRLSYLAENQIENNQYLNQLIQSATVPTGEK
ncbi:anti-sigma factor family protein [Aliikangiella sp. IMCC44653]